MSRLADESVNIGREITTSNGNKVVIIDFYRDNGKIIYVVECCTCKYIDGSRYSYEVIKGNLIPKGRNCPCCSNKKLIPEINSVYYKNSNLLQYFVDINDAKSVTYGNGRILLNLKCPTCGSVKLMTMNDLTNSGFACKKCSSGVSYPNMIMRNILNDINVDFISEYSPDWIKPKRYDFYIPSLNLIIEMDGGLGHGKKLIGKNKNNDSIKDTLAYKNRIDVIRIDCDYGHEDRFIYIKNNIANKLKHILDLDKVKWDDVKLKSESNIVKEVCDYYNETKESSSNIAKFFNLDRSTIISYLKRGSNLNICNYCPMEAKNVRYGLDIKPSAIKIMCVENGMIFNGYTECSNKSVEVFGTYIDRHHISEHINGKRNDVKGFTFVVI